MVVALPGTVLDLEPVRNDENSAVAKILLLCISKIHFTEHRCLHTVRSLR